MAEPTGEHPHARLEDFKRKLKEIQIRMTEDQTLLEVDINTLSEKDMNAWDSYLRILNKMLLELKTSTINISVTQAILGRIENSVTTPEFKLWMQNRVAIHKTNLEVLSTNTEDLSKIIEDVEAEIESFQ